MRARPPVIGIAGRARVGKDTLASFIEAEYGGYRYSLATPIRHMLRAGLGIDLDDDYWAARKEQVLPGLGHSPRTLMQTLGTEWGRNTIHPDLWVVLAHAVLTRMGPGMIVSDVRFDNEAAWIRREKGVVIHLYRDDAPEVAAHTSENGVSVRPEDIQLYNRGSLEDLQFAVTKLWP